MDESRIIVGVDDSPGSHAALQWAADEAVRSGRELLAMHVYDWHVAGAAFQVAGPYEQTAREAADSIVAAAERTVNSHAPGVAVRTATAVGRPGRVLADAAAPQDLLVVGNRGRGGFTSLVLGSVSREVATRSRSSVAVVRARDNAGAGPVVVGVDGPHADNALRAAFEEAGARATSVVVVHAYVPAESVVAYGVLPPVWDLEERHAEELASLRESVSGWTGKYPGVPVEIAAVAGHPVEVLEGLSRTAQLVVLGHHDGRLGEIYLGGVASALLHHADCPVLIVRTSTR